jgi:hypothetical protein
MGTSAREADAAADYMILKMARENPLQTLTEKELRLDVTPVTSYPKPVRAVAWVRFGAIPYLADCWIHRTTSDAAGISFTIRDKTFRCWVWGNAVSVNDEEAPAAGEPGRGLGVRQR